MRRKTLRLFEAVQGTVKPEWAVRHFSAYYRWPPMSSSTGGGFLRSDDSWDVPEKSLTLKMTAGKLLDFLKDFWRDEGLVFKRHENSIVVEGHLPGRGKRAGRLQVMHVKLEKDGSDLGVAARCLRLEYSELFDRILLSMSLRYSVLQKRDGRLGRRESYWV